MIENMSATRSAVVLQFPHMPKLNPNQIFPNRLRELRLERGLTLQKVADLSGIAFTNIGKIETGERDMKGWHMEVFARIYEVAIADLFNPADGGLTKKERELIDTYRDLPAHMQKTFDMMRESSQHLRSNGEVVPISKEEDQRKSA